MRLVRADHKRMKNTLSRSIPGVWIREMNADLVTIVVEAPSDATTLQLLEQMPDGVLCFETGWGEKVSATFLRLMEEPGASLWMQSSVTNRGELQTRYWSVIKKAKPAITKESTE